MTKRLIAIIASLSLLVIAFSGCAEPNDVTDTSTGNGDNSETASDNSGESSLPEEPTFNTTPRDLEFTEYSYLCYINGLYYDENYGISYIIRNVSDFNTFLLLIDYEAHALELKEQFDYNFFQTKTLLMTQITSGTNCTDVYIDSIHMDENGITMNVSHVIYGGDTGTLEQVCFAAVDKTEIEGCDKMAVKIDYRYRHLGGSGAKFDTTPREVPFEQHFFPRIYENFKIDSIDDFYVNVQYDYFKFKDLTTTSYNHGKDDGGFEQYCEDLGFDYFKENSILQIPVVSDNPKSCFEISAINADENGITVTVTHKLDENLNDEKQYGFLLAEISNEQLLGCDRFNVIVNDTAKQLKVPSEMPQKVLNDPNPIEYVDGFTPEGYGTEIMPSDEREYENTNLIPTYVSLVDVSDKLSGGEMVFERVSEKGIELLLCDKELNILQRVKTNSQGYARFVIEKDEHYYVRFAGNEKYMPSGFLDFGEAAPGYLGEYDKTILPVHGEIGYVKTVPRNAENENKITVKFLDAETKQPVPNVVLEGEVDFQLDESGVLTTYPFLGKQIASVSAEGYYSLERTYKQFGENCEVYLTPIDYVEVKISLVDRNTLEPLTENVSVQLYNSAEVKFQYFPVDENGVATLLLDRKVLEESEFNYRATVISKDYLAYAEFRIPNAEKTEYTVEFVKGYAKEK